MPLKLASRPQYEVTGVKGFEKVRFTESSNDWLTLPKAVAFAAEQGSVLQSAREAAAFRIEANGAQSANRYQATRTAAVYFSQDGKPFVAFDDTPEVNENPILSRAEEGYNSHQKNGRFLIPTSQVSALLERAKIDDRIVPLSTSPVVLSTKGSPSEFGEGKLSRAVLGDMAQPYSEFLGKQGYGKGYTYALTGEDMKTLGVTNKNAEVRAVGLGGDDGVYDLGAGDRFGSFGFARGVASPAKFSSGNKAQLLQQAR